MTDDLEHRLRFPQRDESDISPPPPQARPTERFDGVVSVTRTRVWLALVALAATAADLAVWASISQVSVTEEVRSVAIPGGGLTQVVATDEGILTQFRVSTGASVEAGDAIADVLTPDGALTVRAPSAGTMIATIAAPGVAISVDDRIAVIQPEGELALRAFVPVERIASVSPGDRASIAFETLDGVAAPVDGTIASVAAVPFDRDDVALAVGDPALAVLLLGDAEAVVQVDIALASDVDVSAVLPAGADASESVLTALVTIVLDEETPLEFIAR